MQSTLYEFTRAYLKYYSNSLGMGETSDDNEDDDASTAIDIGEAATIRRQLDGLETMYGEVLKLLGLRKFGRPAADNGKANGHSGNGPG